MKTPIQELMEKLNNVKPQDFCSIETIKVWAESLLEKEKEVMCQFAYKCQKRHKVYGDFMIQDYYNETYGGNK